MSCQPQFPWSPRASFPTASVHDHLAERQVLVSLGPRLCVGDHGQLMPRLLAPRSLRGAGPRWLWPGTEKTGVGFEVGFESTASQLCVLEQVT